MKRLIASFLTIFMIAGLFPLTSFAAEFTPTKISADNSTLVGDVNKDGQVTQKDRLILTRWLAGWTKYGVIAETPADINEDGSVTAMDRLLLSRFLSRWEGYETFFAAEESDPLSPDSVYQKLISMKGEYYEGRPWTNADQYEFMHFPPYWKYTGGGCVAFALILSDAVFGDLPLRQIDKGDFTYDDLRTGDIIRMYNDGHSMIILEVLPDHIVVAEGNYNSSIHWGRTIKKDEVMTADYIWTRYPE